MALLPHLWTIAPRLRHGFSPARLPESRPWQTVIDDPKVGPVRLTGRLREVPESDEVLVLVHGLGGCTDSHYMSGGVAAAEGLGISCLRVNLRGADRQGEDFYHAGLTADLHAALASEDLARYRRIYVLGYSLGGHVTLRLGTDEGDPRLVAVAAICSPLDLGRSVVEIDSPALWVYRRYLLKTLKDIYAAVAARRPVPLPVEQALRIRTIREWDDRVVGPRHGFADADDYYTRASVAPLLPRLRVPALLVNSDCDPMVPARAVRPAVENPPPNLHVRWIPGGGHVAFPRSLETGLAGGVGLDAQVVGWMRGR
ncbi:MAG TPA: alpha/beta fold hydrolase [Thermoanaerobaculia bacterium]|nr:alpha/beta fold hydrolase [Thermoanaerobaculia bacterium]